MYHYLSFRSTSLNIFLRAWRAKNVNNVIINKLKYNPIEKSWPVIQSRLKNILQTSVLQRVTLKIIKRKKPITDKEYCTVLDFLLVLKDKVGTEQQIFLLCLRVYHIK